MFTEQVGLGSHPWSMGFLFGNSPDLFGLFHLFVSSELTACTYINKNKLFISSLKWLNS